MRASDGVSTPDGPRRWTKTGREVVLEVAREWSDDEVPGRAAEIAFFTLLSVFPGLLALAAAVSSLDALVGQDLADRAERQTVEFLERVLTSEADAALDAVTALFEQSNAGILTFGVLASLWSASRAVAAVIRGLNAAYDVEDDRTWVGRRATALLLAVGSLVVGLLTIAILVLGPLLGGGREVADAIGFGSGFATAWAVLRLPVAVALIIAWTAIVYHVAPFERTAWRWQLPGAALMAAWAIAASVGLRVYLSTGLTGNEVFGVLGGALILVVWLYLVAIGLLLGGELNAVLARRAGVEPDETPTDLGRDLARLVRRGYRPGP